MPNKKKGNQALKLSGAAKSRKNNLGKQKQRVNASSVTGDGLYKLLGPLAKMAVRAALPGAMQAAGARLMPSASRISGSGDYVTNDIVHAGAASVAKGTSGVPVTKYTHSEYIKDISVPGTPAAFTSQKFSLNSADAGTFPWLSRLAALYTKFRFTKLVFEFRTTTSNYSSAGSLGTVIMAPHYNVASPQFLTKQAMEASTHAVSAAPSTSILMGFECAKKDANVTWYNVLNDLAVARDNFTDPGYVEVATSGLPGTANTTLGELWVHYTCELIEPYISQIQSITTNDSGAMSSYRFGGATANILSTGVFGIQNTGATGGLATEFPGMNYRPSYVTAGVTAPPSDPNWFTYCSGDYFGKGLVFRNPGTYSITLAARLSAAPTTSTGAPFTITASAGSVDVLVGNNPDASDVIWTSGSTWFVYTWVVQVTGSTILTTTLGTGWTGVSTISVPDGWLTIQRAVGS